MSRKNKFVITRWAVSYTHLDVYKRQGLYHVLLLICNRELLFIGKRKDEDDMAKSTKTYEERIRALEKKEQESIEATKKLIAQRKELEKRKKAEESKKRTHRLCQIGGAVESLSLIHIYEESDPL